MPGDMIDIDKQRVAAVRKLDTLGYRHQDREEAELAAITDAIGAYEAVRWPEGKVPGGKG